MEGGDGADTLSNDADNVELDGSAGGDLIYNGYHYYEPYNTFYSSNDNNYKGANATIRGGAGDDTIKNTGNNVLFQYATGDGNDSIVGFNATSTLSVSGKSLDTVKSSTDVIVTTDSGKITLQSAANLSTINIVLEDTTPSALNINNSVGNTILTGTELDDTIRNWGFNVTISGQGGDDFIVNGGSNVSVSGGEGDDTIYNGSQPGNVTEPDGDNVTLNGDAGDDYIHDNSIAYYSNTLNGGTGNDTLWGGEGNDLLSGGADDDLFLFSEGNDTISDYAVGDRISLGAAITKANTSGNDAVLTLGSNTLTIKNGKDKTLSLIDSTGKELSTVISGAKTVTLVDKSSAKVTLPASYANANASKRTTAITIVGNSLDNVITGGSGNDQITAGNGNDSVNGGAGADKIWGGAGADTLDGGTGNDTLNGGAGDDLFIFSAGNDVISDYATGDRISLGAEVSKANTSGNDAVLTLGSNTLTVKNGKDKTLSLIDSTGNEYSTVISGAKTLTLVDTSSAKVTLPASYANADASARTKAITIVGNNLDNSITGSSGNDLITGGAGADSIFGSKGADKIWGGSGNDTLWGGTGNDTLYGGAGADTFLYSSGEGKDIISGFEDTDMLQITGEWTASYWKVANKVGFKVGNTYSAIVLQDFTASTFNINGTAYKISGNTIREVG